MTEAPIKTRSHFSKNKTPTEQTPKKEKRHRAANEFKPQKASLTIRNKPFAQKPSAKSMSSKSNGRKEQYETANDKNPLQSCPLNIERSLKQIKDTVAAVWPKTLCLSSIRYREEEKEEGGRKNPDREYGCGDEKTKNGEFLPPYLLHGRKCDVQVAHGGLGEAFGGLTLLEERKAATRLLAGVSHLERGHCFFMHHVSSPQSYCTLFF